MPSPPDDGTATSTADAFRSELQRLRANRESRPSDRPDRSQRLDGIELGPASVYEAVTRQMVESLASDIREIKGRLNSLLFMLIGGIMLEIAIRLVAP
jgi:hypothetical protein